MPLTCVNVTNRVGLRSIWHSQASDGFLFVPKAATGISLQVKPSPPPARMVVGGADASVCVRTRCRSVGHSKPGRRSPAEPKIYRPASASLRPAQTVPRSLRWPRISRCQPNLRYLLHPNSSRKRGDLVSLGAASARLARPERRAPLATERCSPSLREVQDPHRD
jgi:hypothetical protein